MNIEHIANIVSIIGTCCGLFSRVPQVYKTYKSKSAKDLLSSYTKNFNFSRDFF